MFFRFRFCLSPSRSSPQAAFVLRGRSVVPFLVLITPHGYLCLLPAVHGRGRRRTHAASDGTRQLDKTPQCGLIERRTTSLVHGADVKGNYAGFAWTAT